MCCFLLIKREIERENKLLFTRAVRPLKCAFTYSSSLIHFCHFFIKIFTLKKNYLETWMTVETLVYKRLECENRRDIQALANTVQYYVSETQQEKQYLQKKHSGVARQHHMSRARCSRSWCEHNFHLWLSYDKNILFPSRYGSQGKPQQRLMP